MTAAAASACSTHSKDSQGAHADEYEGRSAHSTNAFARTRVTCSHLSRQLQGDCASVGALGHAQPPRRLRARVAAAASVRLDLGMTAAGTGSRECRFMYSAQRDVRVLCCKDGFVLAAERPSCSNTTCTP